jgi:hypothetical protein
MRFKSLIKTLFAVMGLFLAFYSAGCLALMCERIHNDLIMSSTIFSVSFASISTVFFRGYEAVSINLFG